MKKILLVEDDPAIRQGLENSLTAENYKVLSEADGQKGYKLAKSENVDIIILDIVLPSKDGLEICRDLRSGGIKTPILMLTSKKEEIDKVLGLEIGADDYVTKPFSLRELHARIKALIRRSTESLKEIEVYSFGNVHLDFQKYIAYKDKIPLKLSVLEFRILKYLIQHEDEMISRDKLLDDVWGYDAFPTTRTVDNYILSLRKKIEDDYTKPKFILTVHKGGYRFVNNEIAATI